MVTVYLEWWEIRIDKRLATIPLVECEVKSGVRNVALACLEALASGIQLRDGAEDSMKVTRWVMTVGVAAATLSSPSW